MEESMRIKKVSASEMVCESLQSQIASGAWKTGDRLPSESDLARRFGVNRLTVRMALQKLNALGVLETRTGSGTYVIEFDFENYLREASKFYEQTGLIDDVREFRDHMEIECARLAIERGTEEELKKLEKLAIVHREEWESHDGSDHENWCRRVALADLEFHEQVCRMSHNLLYTYAFAVAREPIYEYVLFCVSKWNAGAAMEFTLDRRRDVHYSIYKSIKEKDFESCKKDYATMIKSYTNIDWSMPVVG
ncbi:MAG: FadR family transcriptional regulator [Clostridia bacterium]|nr:FadR family transcriptional regulator [Clostridia bacterium]